MVNGLRRVIKVVNITVSAISYKNGVNKSVNAVSNQNTANICANICANMTNDQNGAIGINNGRWQYMEFTPFICRCKTSLSLVMVE